MQINSRSKSSLFVRASLIVASALAIALAIQFAMSHRTEVAAGNSDSNSMLVSTAWLADHLSDRSVVIINIGPRAGYDAGHIPGARFLEMSSIAASVRCDMANCMASAMANAEATISDARTNNELLDRELICITGFPPFFLP